MADTGIFATTAEVQRKVGADASSTANSEAYINQFMSEAESYINDVVRYNFSDAYSGLNADVKGILKEAASNLAAVYVINYDMSGYLSLQYAESMKRTLLIRFQECIMQLLDKKREDFMVNA